MSNGYKRDISLVGCGAVGKALGRLLYQSGQSILDVAGRSVESAQLGSEFIGAGRPVTLEQGLRPSDVVILAVPDDAIGDVVANRGLIPAIQMGTIVIHCSGALGSGVMAPLKRYGARLASAHPVMSFSDPQSAVGGFKGVFCAVEGDIDARDEVHEIFERLGAQCFLLESDKKIIYHAAAVMACNYLTALIECAVQSAQRAGLSRQQGMLVLEPLVRGTVEAVFSRGTAQALTGPVARGDHGLVKAQLEALNAWDQNRGDLYRLLGREALMLAKSGKRAPEQLLDLVAQSLGLDTGLDKGA